MKRSESFIHPRRRTRGPPSPSPCPRPSRGSSSRNELGNSGEEGGKKN